MLLTEAVAGTLGPDWRGTRPAWSGHTPHGTTFQSIRFDAEKVSIFPDSRGWSGWFDKATAM